MAIRRIGVLTSGGDATGMNACVRSVVRTALYHGIEIYGIRRGWHGLITGDVVKLDKASVSRIINKGGTILYTARSKEFMTEEGQRKAASTCKFLGLDSVIAIGGDGTFRGAQALSKFGINVIGIPATIDNDIGCTKYCLGFDTAANTAIECIDKLRDTMQSHERCSVVEVMGRHAGYLALYVGISIGATAVLIPEHPVDFERDVADKIRRARLSGSTHYMIVAAEGAGPPAAGRHPHRTGPRDRQPHGLQRRYEPAGGSGRPHHCLPRRLHRESGHGGGSGYGQDLPDGSL